MNDEVAQKMILIADDDPFITHAYKTGLENAGYVVMIAQDGEEALKQIRSLHPDVVLLEIILPKLDGFTVLKTMKAETEIANIPVIVLTNLSQESDALEARNSGAVDVLVKSDVALNDILLCIERLLEPDAQ
jgi:DNA-binding response OmpR family regulator